jgi:hypothetical protein
LVDAVVDSATKPPRYTVELLSFPTWYVQCVLQIPGSVVTMIGNEVNEE